MLIEKEAQKRSFKVSPVRWVGKKLTNVRSPVYKTAMDMLGKVDDLIRESVLDQKSLLKDMKKFGKGMSVINFINAANAFDREQRVVLAAVAKMQQKYKELAKNWGGDINMAINADLGRTPEPTQQFDTTKTQDYVDQKLSALGELADVYEGLVKEALWGGRYWRSRTESGKQFAKNFDVIQARFAAVFNKNVETLKALDEVRDVGDPGSYLNKALKEFKGVKFGADAAFQSAWAQMEKIINEKQKEQEDAAAKSQEEQSVKQKQELRQKSDEWNRQREAEIERQKAEEQRIKQIREDAKKAEEETTRIEQQSVAPVETKPSSSNAPTNREIAKQQLELLSLNDSIPRPAKRAPTDKQIQEQRSNRMMPNPVPPQTPITPEQLDLPDVIEGEKQLSLNFEPTALKAKSSFLFLDSLTKQSANLSNEEIAIELLKYADEIDGKNTQLAIELTNIAEKILNA